MLFSNKFQNKLAIKRLYQTSIEVIKLKLTKLNANNKYFKKVKLKNLTIN